MCSVLPLVVLIASQLPGASAAADGASTGAGLKPLSSGEMAGVAGQMIWREHKSCDETVWKPCTGSGGCYWDTNRQKCVTNLSDPVPSCQPSGNNNWCEVHEDPPFRCCLRVCIPDNANPPCDPDCVVYPEQCTGTQCDYRRCDTYFNP
jgi:hypothetical protein